MTDFDFATIGEQLGQALEPLNQAMVDVQTRWRAIADQMAEYHQSAWADLSQKLKEALERTKEALEKAETLGAFGWTLPMNATPREYVALMDQVTDLQTADSAFTAYYTSHQSARLMQLKSHLLSCGELQYWAPLIEEAIFALDAGKHRICVAALLPTIDGFMDCYWAPLSYKDSIRKRFLKGKLQVAKPVSMNHYMWRSVGGFVEAIFRTAKNAKPPLVNRHWILHGRGIPDSSLADCLRLLQALDTIGALARLSPEPRQRRRKTLDRYAQIVHTDAYENHAKPRRRARGKGPGVYRNPGEDRPSP